MTDKTKTPAKPKGKSQKKKPSEEMKSLLKHPWYKVRYNLSSSKVLKCPVCTKPASSKQCHCFELVKAHCKYGPFVVEDLFSYGLPSVAIQEYEGGGISNYLTVAILLGEDGTGGKVEKIYRFARWWKNWLEYHQIPRLNPEDKLTYSLSQRDKSLDQISQELIAEMEKLLRHYNTSRVQYYLEMLGCDRGTASRIIKEAMKTMEKTWEEFCRTGENPFKIPLPWGRIGKIGKSAPKGRDIKTDLKTLKGVSEAYERELSGFLEPIIAGKDWDLFPIDQRIRTISDSKVFQRWRKKKNGRGRKKKPKSPPKT